MNNIFFLIPLFVQTCSSADVPHECVSAFGSIKVADCRLRFPERQVLSASEAGILCWTAKEGDVVSTDEVVARLDETIAAARLAVARQRTQSNGRRQRAVKLHQMAQRELELAKLANRSVEYTYVEAELDRRKSAVALANLEVVVEDDELNVSVLEQQLQEQIVAAHKLKARISGTVVRLTRTVGESVASGAEVLEIVNTNRIRAEGFVNETSLSELRKGQCVTLYLSSGDELDGLKLDGKIVFIDVSIQPVSRLTRIWADFDNTDFLAKEGMTAEMRISKSGKEVSNREEMGNDDK